MSRFSKLKYISCFIAVPHTKIWLRTFKSSCKSRSRELDLLSPAPFISLTEQSCKLILHLSLINVFLHTIHLFLISVHDLEATL